MPKLPNYLSQFTRLLAQHFGLVILVVYLLIVALKNWPVANEWLMGWDNFSVTTNLWLNLKRTLFATWREYRGFGVASDSEVVDVFRQLPLFFLQAFSPDYLLEWFYYFGMYSLGAMGAYFLTIHALRRLTITNSFTTWHWTLVGLCGAIFYATNLYSLEVFYTPIVMYTARFGFLPWLVLLSWQWLTDKQPKTLVRLGIISIFAMPAFLTATVFFVWMIILGSLVLFFGRWQKKLSLLAITFLLNAFWLLPFGWYTLTKVAIIPKSGTFVAINEILLNAPYERFELDKLLTFTGEFGSGIHFTDLQKQPVPQHPFFHQTPLGSYPKWYYFSTWPIILIGTIFILRRSRSYQSQLGWWLMVLFVTSLWLLTKEYSPLGVVYNLLSKTIPFLQVVLRFGGTKLNPILILIGTIASGAATLWLLESTIAKKTALWRRLISTIGIPLVISAIGWMSVAPLTGQFTAKIIRTQLPQAYFQLAEIINQDAVYGRVLHLPTGLYSYWRSHSWGYYGSSFLSFMIQKPTIEKTFSPGNLDHDYFDQALTTLTLNFETIDQASKTKRAQQLAHLLKRSSIRHLVLDSSIQPTITSKNLLSWEVHPLKETQLLLAELSKLGGLTEVNRIPIDQQDPTAGEIVHYVFDEDFTAFTTPTDVLAVDPELANTFIEPLFVLPQTIVQSNDLQYRSYPWWQTNFIYTPHKNSFSLVTRQQETPTSLTIPAPTKTANAYQAVDFFAAIETNQLRLYAKFSQPILDQQPSIQDSVLIYSAYLPKPSTFTAWSNPKDYLNNWHVLPSQTIQPLRVAISDQVLPLPTELTNTPSYIGSLLLAQQLMNTIPISLLIPESTGPALIDTNLLSPTENPNCLNDGTSLHQAKLTFNQGSLYAVTTQGSFCFGTAIDLLDLKKISTGTDNRNYFELSFVAQSESSTILPDITQPFPLSRQLAITELMYQQEPLTQTAVCLSTQTNGPCLNGQTILRTTKQPHRYILTTNRLFEEPQLNIVYSVLTDLGTHAFSLEKLEILRFTPSNTLSTNLAELLPTATRRFELISGQPQFPYPLSTSSLYPSTATGLQLQNPTKCIQNPSATRPSSYHSLSQTATDALLYSESCSLTLSTTLPYYSSNAYFWSTQYQTITGNQPRLLVDATSQIYNKLFSQADHYPNIPGSKPLEPTTSLAGSEIFQTQLRDILQQPTYATTSTSIAPIGSIAQPTGITFAVNLASTNQSLLRLTTPTVFAIPPEWQASYVETAESIHQFAKLSISDTVQFLPSFWSLTLSNPDSSANTQALLAFDQAFDPGWVVINQKLERILAKHVRVDGWKNGWLFDANAFKTPQKLYVVYWPELISLLGWMITIPTIGVIVFQATKNKSTALTHSLATNKRVKQLSLRLRKVLAPKS